VLDYERVPRPGDTVIVVRARRATAEPAPIADAGEPGVRVLGVVRRVADLGAG
jgi:hypothetical protein